LRGIAFTNKRKKAGGFYMEEEQLKEIIEQAFPVALTNASDEAFEGKITEEELEKMIEVQSIKNTAFEMIVDFQNSSL
jgi:hypothetical protein